MKNKLLKTVSDCKNIFFNAKLLLNYIKGEKSGKKYFVYKFSQSIISALIPLILMTLPGLLINTLSREEFALYECVVYLGIILVLPVLNYFINVFLNYQLKKVTQQIELGIDINFYKHIMTMDYEVYENPDIQINKSRSLSALSKVWSVSDILFGFITQIISLLTVILVISFLNPVLLILVVFFSILFSIIKKKVNKSLFTLDQKGSEIDRRMWGVTYMLDQQDYAKEIRLFNMPDLLLNEYKRVKEESIDLNMDYLKKQNVPNNYNSFLELVQNIFIYIYLVFNVVKKSMPIGNFAIYLSYYGKLEGVLKGFLSSFLELAQISLNVDELNQFMKLPKKIHDSGNLHPNYSKGSIIEFRNVSFKYPGSDIYALKNVNISIDSNEKLCIVGPNGAGKSTFIKLLTRLYSPTEGIILLNGRNIAEYDAEEYMRLFSPVFQDFVKYYFSIGINIALTADYDVNKLDRIMRQCHLDSLIQKLPKGYDTQVSKWIDPEGIEPSGGENQRIAIARALYNEGKIYILDEPTAALDPNAEYEIYMQFNNMIIDKCAILVTHRLSAVQLADKVAVFNNGQIAEYGTHAELYAKGGIYTEMFDKQAQFYRNE
ncbi:MAG: ABC transporter ATP-binding protein [Clostridiales bacterium]|nr:ABC transporter ATP-binding protein [Clostridiales bacterium]